MNFSQEPWRKLYLRESLEQQGWPLFARALRDLLLRFAREDGTLIARTGSPGEDLARLMRAAESEVGPIVEAVELMIEDGFLTHERGQLAITRFEAGQMRSTSTERVQRMRARSRAESLESGTLQKHVTKHQSETDPIRYDPIRSDPKRECRARPHIADIVPKKPVDADPKPAPAHLPPEDEHVLLDPRAVAIAAHIAQQPALAGIRQPQRLAERIIGNQDAKGVTDRPLAWTLAAVDRVVDNAEAAEAAYETMAPARLASILVSWASDPRPPKQATPPPPEPRGQRERCSPEEYQRRKAAAIERERAEARDKSASMARTPAAVRDLLSSLGNGGATAAADPPRQHTDRPRPRKRQEDPKEREQSPIQHEATRKETGT